MPSLITLNGKTVTYVVNQNDGGRGTVTPISTAANTAGRPIEVGQSAFSAAITPNGKTVYVVMSLAGSVTPISTATSKPGKAIKVAASFALTIAITPDGKTAYVGGNASKLPGVVTPINTAT